MEFKTAKGPSKKKKKNQDGKSKGSFMNNLDLRTLHAITLGQKVQ